MATATSAFAAQVLRGRWFMAYGSFLIMSAAGATYIFAIYSKDIKATLGYSQEQLNTVTDADPLIITEAEIAKGMDILEQALTAVFREPGHIPGTDGQQEMR